MIDVGLIGGTGLVSLPGLSMDRQETLTTPWGEPSAALCFGRYAGRDIVFLPRHGQPHTIPPHRVNYRANLHALKDAGARRVLGINAVGGITPDMRPCRLVIPDQIIDYTWGRRHTYFEDGPEVVHIDFTRPYAGPLRDRLLAAAGSTGIDIAEEGTYGASQGPRLETAAEIERMQRDGCDIVGMTGMPETALARELELDYACLALVVNRAAGKAEEEITMDTIRANLERGMADVQRVLQALMENLGEA